MKSKDLQNVVLSKYQNGDTPTIVYHDLSGAIGLRTIKWWFQMICQTGTTSLSSPPGYSRLVRTKVNVKKVKDHLRRKSRVIISWKDRLRSSIVRELVSGEY